MKISFHTVMLLVGMFFISFQAHALPESEPVIQLSISHSELCSEATIVVYKQSTHPGGNVDGWLNERNRGIGFRCPLKKRIWGNPYFTMGGLENSQFGSTFVAGFGFTTEVARLKSLSLRLGVEVPYIYYEHPRAQEVYYGFLPIGVIELNLDLPYGWGQVGYVQYHLGDTGVRLYAIVYRIEF